MLNKEDYDTLVSKHIVSEATRLLLDKKYLELGDGTDEEIELAHMIACTLHEIAPSLKHGVTLDELTVCLFPAMFAVIAAIGLMTTLVVVEPAIQKAFAERNAYSLCITSSLL